MAFHDPDFQGITPDPEPYYKKVHKTGVCVFCWHTNCLIITWSIVFETSIIAVEFDGGVRFIAWTLCRWTAALGADSRTSTGGLQLHYNFTEKRLIPGNQTIYKYHGEVSTSPTAQGLSFNTSERTDHFLKTKCAPQTVKSGYTTFHTLSESLKQAYKAHRQHLRALFGFIHERPGR